MTQSRSPSSPTLLQTATLDDHQRAVGRERDAVAVLEAVGRDGHAPVPLEHHHATHRRVGRREMTGIGEEHPPVGGDREVVGREEAVVGEVRDRAVTERELQAGRPRPERRRIVEHPERSRSRSRRSGSRGSNRRPRAWRRSRRHRRRRTARPRPSSRRRGRACRRARSSPPTCRRHTRPDLRRTGSPRTPLRSAHAPPGSGHRSRWTNVSRIGGQRHHEGGRVGSAR